MIKLTERREITPYTWLHPDEERFRSALEGEADLSVGASANDLSGHIHNRARS